MIEFIRRVPDGASLTLESIQRNVLPVNAMATAMGLHTRCGNEDTLWGRKGEHATSVQQIEQIVRLAGELGREVATAQEAREIYQIGTWYDGVDETLHRLGLPPNRRPGHDPGAGARLTAGALQEGGGQWRPSHSLPLPPHPNSRAG